MQTLGPLTTPLSENEHRLQLNAAPTLAALKTDLRSLHDAISSFSGRNDNRAAIEKLTNALMQRSWELSDVSGADLALMAAEQLHAEYRNSVGSSLRTLEMAAGEVFSDDASAQFPLRTFRQALRRVRERFGDFTFANDNRGAITAAVQVAMERLDEVRAMRVEMAEWRPAAVETRAKELTGLLAREIPATPEPLPEPRTLNVLRTRMSDDAYELECAIAGLGINDQTGGLEDLRAVFETAKAIGLIARENIFTELSLEQSERVGKTLLDIDTGVRNLERRRYKVDGVQAVVQARTPPILSQVNRMRLILGPSVSQPAPQSSLMSKVAGALGFGWEDSPEVA